MVADADADAVAVAVGWWRRWWADGDVFPSSMPYACALDDARGRVRARKQRHCSSIAGVCRWAEGCMHGMMRQRAVT